ncbi:interferon-stimulated 20 kDa exonuclease-like 2 [Pyxicephalus adspersus]|uniref:interferon-stimulated 20 kDa exonuclease-like 2 n=1 Tax=Pyxicephalus adspersus TaxID=30357 RepID=UPI003B5C6CEC
MADMFLNLKLGGGQPRGNAEQGNKKHQRFIKRRKFLEKKGFLKEKQLPQKLPDRRRGQPRDPGDPSRHKGQQWTERAHSNLFCSAQQGAPSRTIHGQCQSSTLTVSFNAKQRVATFTPQVPASSNKDGAGRPGPKASLQPNINPLSEYESGIPSASSTPSYKIVAIDCEMVGTGQKGSVSALARCSIVGYYGDVVYDKYIKPSTPVTDYRTKWSGIRREHLANAIPFSAAQKEILKILQGKMVIGHAIHNDYKALGYFHPPELTRDTSKIPLLNRRAGFPEKEMASLKRLAKQLLRKDIQMGRGGHSSVEDAKATMELYRVVEAEYEKQLASGQATL